MRHVTDADKPFTLGKAFLPVYLPTILFAVAEGAIIPIVPSIATRLGADLAIAGIIQALLTIGSLLGNLPAGSLVAKFGERMSMIAASGVTAIGAVICFFSQSAWQLGIGIFVIGLSHSVFALARHAFMTTFVPLSHRARALSTLGGMFRAGIFIGPFLTAAVIYLFQDSSLVFWAVAVLSAAIAVLLRLIADPTEALLAKRMSATGSIPISAIKRESIFRVIITNSQALLRVGVPSAILAGLRNARYVILPLWAVSIGVGESSIAIVIGIANAIDFALFYTGGLMMDKFGRLFTVLPSLLGLSLGILALGFTHDLDSRMFWFVTFAIFLSVANGISSGVLMTLSADLAPKHNPAPFLGAWRFTTDAGQALTPMVIAGITALSSISIAAFSIGGIGLVGAALYLKFLPRYDPLNQKFGGTKP